MKVLLLWFLNFWKNLFLTPPDVITANVTKVKTEAHQERAREIFNNRSRNTELPKDFAFLTVKDNKVREWLVVEGEEDLASLLSFCKRYKGSTGQKKLWFHLSTQALVKEVAIVVYQTTVLIRVPSDDHKNIEQSLQLIERFCEEALVVI